MRFVGSCYRAHDPQWSHKPISGQGAALRGGRFNPVGIEALYLSLSPVTALKEVSRGLGHRLDPLVLCEYDVDVDDIVDLRTRNGRTRAKTSLPAMRCAWLADHMEGRVPLSWHIYHELRAGRLPDDKAAGIIVPSFSHSRTKSDVNLVLWDWGPDLPHRVEVFDPSGRLPKNQLSWA